MYLSQKARLAKYLGANIVLWGIVMMLHAVPDSFGAFFALRLILGMALALDPLLSSHVIIQAC
jgi:MFS transporter, ACS family, allantoate permease